MTQIYKPSLENAELRIAAINQLVEMHKQGLLGGETMPEDALVRSCARRVVV